MPELLACAFDPAARPRARAPRATRARTWGLAIAFAAGIAGACCRAADEAPFFALLSEQEGERLGAADQLRKDWQPSHTVRVVELLRFAPPEARPDLFQLLRSTVGERRLVDLHSWQQWLWNRPPAYDPAEYSTFKAMLYARIDPAFARYFVPGRAATIRLDEIVWGGVSRDGIPPLRDPAMIPAGQAAYLRDEHIVFGVEINGDARAYPKRILAWHELFTANVGGEPVAGVYCTLCGSVVIYETTFAGIAHELGTSGFLYRSNKLMYDRATQSLWSTLEGKPVLGPLVGRGIALRARSVVTTTWGEWRRRHPQTTVLSLETGHRRNYREGAAYRSYFANDELMFAVPQPDGRLKNKDEVLALRFPDAGAGQLAIASEFLQRQPVFQGEHNGAHFVVLTDATGANRVYSVSEDLRFASWNQADRAFDQQGVAWRVTEPALLAEDGRVLERLPAHRAFWFGWRAAFPETRLIGAPGEGDGTR